MRRLMFAKLEVWLIVLLLGLSSSVFAVWGAAVIEFRVFPFEILREAKLLLTTKTHRPLHERIMAAFVFDPVFNGVPVDEQDFEGFATLRKADGYRGAALSVAAMRARGTFVEDAQAGAAAGERRFLIYGNFPNLTQQAHFGVLLVDGAGTVHRGWSIRPSAYHSPVAHIGFDVGADGQLLTNAHGRLTAQSWCGDDIWEAPWPWEPEQKFAAFFELDGYDWHHDIVIAEDLVYSMRGPNISIVRLEDGTLHEEIHLLEVLRWAWAQGLYFLDPRLDIAYSNSNGERPVDHFLEDPFHHNKVDVLRAEDADQYPGLEAGDLLLGFREPNAVVVIRPSEQRIVWWRAGLTSRQHDPTFADGAIEVFDNRPFTWPPSPQIIRLMFDRWEAETIFDLSTWDFPARVTGNFVRNGEELLVVASGDRMILGDIDGTRKLEIVNLFQTDDGELNSLVLRDAVEVSAADVERWEAGCDPVDPVRSAGVSR